MRDSHCHDPSEAWGAVLEEAKFLQSLQAVPQRPSVVGMAHAGLDTSAFQNALRKAFTREVVVLAVDNRLVKNGKIPWRLIEEEAILVDLEEGEVLRLNPVGAEIWNTIDGTRTVAEIVAHNCRTFDVSERTARRDVRRFLKQLLRHELVEELLSVSTESA